MVPKVLCSVLVSAIVCNIVGTDGRVINQLVDTVIKEVVKKIEKNVAIPHLEKVFHLGFLELGLNATSGNFGNLETLYRTADATLDFGEEALIVTLPLALETMEIEFTDCELWLDDASVADSLVVSINKNAISATIAVESTDESCNVVVNSAEVTLLDDVGIVMDKMGEEELVTEELINWILEHFNNKVKASVESKLKTALAAEIDQINLCQYI